MPSFGGPSLKKIKKPSLPPSIDNLWSIYANDNASYVCVHFIGG